MGVDGRSPSRPGKNEVGRGKASKIEVQSSSTSEYISKSDNDRGVEMRSRDWPEPRLLKGTMASAESVVMKVETLAMDARNFCSLIL